MTIDMAGMKEIKTPDGIWRYVDHKRKLATAGFTLRHGLRRNRKLFSGHPEALRAMSNRYVQFFSPVSV